MGKELLKKGLVKQIGNGASTKIWEDQWIGGESPRRLVSPCQYPNMTVSTLIDHSSGTWIHERLIELFCPEDVEAIKRIRLSRYNQRDRYVWPFTMDLQYTVKSGYWAATHVLWEEADIIPPQGSLQIKKQIWDLEILPKIQHFLWKAVSGALPTFVQMCTRGIHIDPVCQRCCMDEETINHVLFLCPHAMGTWRCSGLPLQYFQSLELETNLTALFSLLQRQDIPSRLRKFSFWVLWYIWKSRNEFIFNKRNVHPMEDISRAIEGNNEWIQNFTSEKNLSVRVNRSLQWEPPPTGWLKCNFDSSYKKEEHAAGLGWIVRDSNGSFIKSGMLRTENIMSPLEAEALAFLNALQQIWINGWRLVWFEGDNSEITRIINTVVLDHALLGNILSDIRYWMSRLTECSLGNVNRERNMAADVLAKRGLAAQDDNTHFFHTPPVWLVNYLYWPYTI